MKSLSIGHFTNTAQGTGLSVFIFEQPAIAAYCVPGSSPATREMHILDVDSNVDHIDALMFTGGSAYGLGAANGVMKFLHEKGQGKKMPHGGIVPIVAAAGIYDLAFKEPAYPSSEDAYTACQQAKINDPVQGSIGAGTGASIGKLIPDAQRMKGGLGLANIKLNQGLEVMAYAVVNAVGDIRDASGKIIAGAQRLDGSFVDCRQYYLEGNSENSTEKENTTLVAVFTNASFSKIELKRIAKMAVAGIAQSITPVFTRYDGDVVFCVSLGDVKASELTVGTMAVEAVRQAIINSVKGE